MKYFTLLAMVSVLGLSACKKDVEDTLPPCSQTNRVINTDLASRVTYKSEPINLTGKRGATNTTQFNYVADVSSPVVNGATLSATGIAFQGNKAYVSYHWNGNDGDYGGALEVIDVTNPAQPTLISSLFFTDADLNEVYVEGNKAYVVGGRDIYTSGYAQTTTNGGIVEVVDLQAGLLTNTTQQAPIPSYSGNSVFKSGNKLLVTSGNTGGGAFELSLQPNSYLNLTDADYYSNSKFGVADQGKFIFLEGGPSAKLHLHANNNFSPTSKSTIILSASQSPLNGKGVLFVEGNQAYVSAGAFGLLEFDLSANSGTPVQSFNAGGNGFVNGVGADNEFVYVANGNDGMFIINRSDFVQRAVFSFTGSANYVAANGQNVFIANGIGGLKILAKSSPVDPYCTNETALEPYAGSPGIMRLTAMGNYVENGQYGKRWRIRNETAQTVTVTWDIYGSPLNGQFTVPAMTALHFTSHSTGSAGNGGTMRLFQNGQQIQVKAHGGSTKYLGLCNGSGVNACTAGSVWNTNTTSSVSVTGNQSLVHNGSIAFQNDLNVEGELYYCGAMSVGTNLLIQNGGMFDMYGSLVINSDLNLGANSTLIIEGSLTVNGNFNFAGTIEFAGNGSSLHVNGNVNNNGGTAIGTWTGTQL